MGGSGGGGGSSGAVSWPEYLENMHSTWLNALNNTLIPEMIANNPFIDQDAFDPATDLGLAWSAVCEFDAFVDSLNYINDWTNAITSVKSTVDSNIIDDTYIDADIAAFSDTIENELNTRILPQFKAGMRDVNAVMSSAFVLGEADIYSTFTKEVTKYGTDLRAKLHLQRNELIAKSTAVILQNLMTIGELEGKVANISVDAKRIAIVAQKEENDMNLEIDENEARWDNEAYVYGANMLAAISGGTRGGGASKPTSAQSALGGALSGAAIGAQVSGGNPLGAAVGGIIGLGAGLLFN